MGAFLAFSDGPTRWGEAGIARPLIQNWLCSTCTMTWLWSTLRRTWRRRSRTSFLFPPNPSRYKSSDYYNYHETDPRLYLENPIKHLSHSLRQILKINSLPNMINTIIAIMVNEGLTESPRASPVKSNSTIHSEETTSTDEINQWRAFIKFISLPPLFFQGRRWNLVVVFLLTISIHVIHIISGPGSSILSQFPE